MKRSKRYSLSIILLAVFALLMLISAIGPSRLVTATVTPKPPPANNFTVFATGLNNPRGLKFGPDGNLYVAEGGPGGSNQTIGLCTQVDPPIGPYFGSNTGGRISRIDQAGNRTTVIDTLPSSQTAPASGSLISGVADVAFIDNTLYALLSGAGCSHGVTSRPNGIVRINSNGSATLVADLSAFIQANPVADPPADFEPDGTFYSMVVVRGDFYVVEPNHGQVLQVTPGGETTRLLDVSAVLGHIVPTAITYKGNFFVGNLGTFPIIPGTEKVIKLNPGGNLRTWVTGLTTVLGLAFDGRDRLYVLESLTNPGFPGPGQLNSGRVVRIDPSGDKTVIATGLNAPGGMTFGPDGALYVSNFSFTSPLGAGQIVRIEVPSKGGKNLIHSDNSEVSSQQPLPAAQPAVAPAVVPKISAEPETTRKQSSVDIRINVQQFAASKLSDDPDLSGVSVTVSASQVVLTGTVPSAAAKARAEKVMRSVVGAKLIENKIEVSAP